jgi:glycosyltransferase involved in cell wall biosynthesis
MRKVVVVQRSIAQYRIEFWNQLKIKLEEKGVQLHLVYSKFKHKDALKNDEVELEWALYVPSMYLRLFKMQLSWQFCYKYLRNTDLVIVEQANQNLLNYFLIFLRPFVKRKLAFWGHGRNMQIAAADIRNKFKNLLTNKCDWWFAYTEGVRRDLVEGGFNPASITSLDNAIDTKSLVTAYTKLNDSDNERLKMQLNIESSHIAIYCGAIYKEKRIDFFIQACDLIKEKVPDFHAIVIGAGPDQGKVIDATNARSWIHYIGNKFGTEKVKYFKISSVFMMPGLVGLGILDAFAMGTPLVTTQYPYHSPEIEYLKNGVNGLMTNDDVHEYSESVVKLLTDSIVRKKLMDGCAISAKQYTVENMVDNFATGIVKCLNINI